jgi:T5SS/PEP-CTERM-associated repeat protein
MRILLIGFGILFIYPQDANAVTQTWNPGGSGGRSGTWSTTAANWGNSQVWTDGNSASIRGLGGTITVSGVVTVDNMDFNASGTYTLTGAALSTQNVATISAESPVILSSTLESTGATTADPSSTITLTGTWTGSYILSLDLFVSGTGVFQVHNTGAVFADNVSVGEQPGMGNVPSNMSVSGMGAVVTATENLQVGEYGDGTLQVSNGGAVSCETCYIGGTYYTGLTGVVSVTGAGTLVATNAVEVGWQGEAGLMQISNGGIVTAPASYVNSTGTLAFGPNAVLQGTLGVEAGVLKGSGSGSTLSLNGAVTLDNATLILDIDASTNLADSLSLTAGSLTMLDYNTLAIDVVNGTQLTQQSYVLITLPSGESINGVFDSASVPAGYALRYQPGELELVSTASVPEPGTWAGLLVGLGAVAIALRRRS